EEIVILARNVLEEDIRRFAAKFQRHWNEALTGVLHDEPARRRLAGEGDLGDAVRRRQRLAGLEPKAIDDVEDALGKEIADDFGPDENRRGRLFGRLHYGP